MTSKVTVVVVDDDARFRRAMTAVLDADDRVEQVGEAATLDEALRVVGDSRPDCVLVDVRMPGHGPDLVCAILDEVAGPPPVVVAVTADNSAVSVAEMVVAGATGYLVKGQIGDVVVDLVLRCVRGEVILASTQAGTALRALRGRG